MNFPESIRACSTPRAPQMWLWEFALLRRNLPPAFRVKVGSGSSAGFE
jgi:hypothetical protein